MKKSNQNNQSMQLKTSVDVLIGRAAMIGFVLMFGAYLTADVISPGII